MHNVCSDFNLKGQYDVQVANLQFNSTSAIRGKTSAVFTDDTRVAIYSMGPFTGGEMISCTLHFKTSSYKEMILVVYGGVFGISKRKDIFLLTLKDGNPVLYFGGKKYLTTDENHNLNDDQWHHIAISIPWKSCLSSRVGIIVDGTKATTSLNGKDEHLFFTTSGKLSLGGWGYSNSNYETAFPTVSNFVGMMDNFQMWAGSPITAEILRKAAKKNFEINRGVICKFSENRQFRSRRTAKQCSQMCQNRPACWGYELRNRVQNKYLCHHHLKHRPTILKPSDVDNQCNPVVR